MPPIGARGSSRFRKLSDPETLVPETPAGPERMFLFQLTAHEARDRIAAGDLSAAELLESVLQRIEAAYPDKEVDVPTYGPALATHVGPGAMGVFVYEGME